MYNVQNVIGNGGFGTVYAGTSKSDGQLVAIKHIGRSKVTEWVEVSLNTRFISKFRNLNGRKAEPRNRNQC